MIPVLIIFVCSIHLICFDKCMAVDPERAVYENAKQFLHTVGTFTKHVMSQEFYQQYIGESEGNSGITKIHPPFGIKDLQNWEQHFVYDVTPPIHSHPEKRGVLGLADLSVVMNGVHFRLGHTDYTLRSRGNKEHGFMLFEQIEFPIVPPEVQKQRTVEGQIAEMRLWFKAWRDQDYSKRDYRNYFKPVLCYLEGTWKAYSKSTLMKRYSAKSIHDLLEQVRFTSYTEMVRWLPHSHLPLTVFTRMPQIGQWDYHVLCHPLKKDLPLKDIHLIDDVENRMALGAVSISEYSKSNAARFRLSKLSKDGMKRTDKLDEVMQEVPGLDGYSGRIIDKVFERTAVNYDTKKPLNTAFYHRWYRTRDGVGHRSFSDTTLFMARNNHNRVLKMRAKYCRAGHKQCKIYEIKSSFAIPLEVVYLTPLHRWDPFGLEVHRKVTHVTGSFYYTGPNGKLKGSKRKHVRSALNGSNGQHFYMTPYQFFSTLPAGGPGDTGLKPQYVVDSGGFLRRVVASGIYAQLPEIPGVGRLRTRYPIMPLHGEGDPAWMELSALNEMILNPKKYLHMREDHAEQAFCMRPTTTTTTTTPKPTTTTTPKPTTTTTPKPTTTTTPKPTTTASTTITTTTRRSTTTTTHNRTTATTNETATLTMTTTTTPNLTTTTPNETNLTTTPKPTTTTTPKPTTTTTSKPNTTTTTTTTMTTTMTTKPSTTATTTTATTTTTTPPTTTSTEHFKHWHFHPWHHGPVYWSPYGWHYHHHHGHLVPVWRPPMYGGPHGAVPYSGGSWMPHPGAMPPPPPPPPGAPGMSTQRQPLVLVLVTDKSPPSAGSHQHYVVLGGGQLSDLLGGKLVNIITQVQNGHVHPMGIQKTGRRVAIKKCDSGKQCRHSHGHYLHHPTTTLPKPTTKSKVQPTTTKPIQKASKSKAPTTKTAPVQQVKKSNAPPTKHGQVHGTKKGHIHHAKTKHVHHAKAKHVHPVKAKHLHQVKAKHLHHVKAKHLHHVKAKHLHHVKAKHLHHAKTKHVHQAKAKHVQHVKAKHLHHVKAKHLHDVKAKHLHHAKTKHLHHAKTKHVHQTKTKHVHHVKAKHMYHRKSRRIYHGRARHVYHGRAKHLQHGKPRYLHHAKKRHLHRTKRSLRMAQLSRMHAAKLSRLYRINRIRKHRKHGR